VIWGWPGRLYEGHDEDPSGIWRWKDIWCKAGLYLRRLYLAWTPRGHASVHWLHKPDSADHHDHPASFLSIVLRGGYVEEVATYDQCWDRHAGGAVRWDVHTRRVRWFNFKRAEDAHAETVQKLGPFTPYRMETSPAAMSGMNIGTKKGETRSGPFWR